MSILPSSDPQPVRLSQLVRKGGCAAKVDAIALDSLLRNVPSDRRGSSLIIGVDEREDAAVIRIDDNRGLVYTVDFIPPVVDDPYAWGQIAAANAISDVYAMGGMPAFALSVFGYPSQVLTQSMTAEVLRGADTALARAGTVLAGGHTIDFTEPFFGLSVIGNVDLDGLWLKSQAQVGDYVILTKAIGTGLLLSALKSGHITHEECPRLLPQLLELNDTAAQLLKSHAHAVTDVTGFGLAVQLVEIARQSSVAIELSMEALPIIPGAIDIARAGIATSLTASNRRTCIEACQIEEDADDIGVSLLFDPQTNGGLLATLGSIDALEIAEEMRVRGLESATVIGRVMERSEEHPHLVVRRNGALRS